MPLDFLKRKNTGDGTTPAAPAPAAAPATGSVTLPEEVVAQEFQLKLYYAGKTSEGVRMQTGPQAMAELPSMLVGLAKSEIELVEPLPIEFSQATPTIARPSEAMQWLNAHHVHSPITRHALVVLESLTPAERVAFVLHEVFGVPFAEIGEIGRASCRERVSNCV